MTRMSKHIEIVQRSFKGHEIKGNTQTLKFELLTTMYIKPTLTLIMQCLCRVVICRKSILWNGNAILGSKNILRKTNIKTLFYYIWFHHKNRGEKSNINKIN